MNCRNFTPSHSRSTRPVLPFALLFAALPLVPAIAQTPAAARAPITAEIKFVSPFVKLGAPIPVVLDVASDKMREVSFLFKISSGREEILDYRSDPRVLSPGKQRFNILIPSPRMFDTAYALSAELTVSALTEGFGSAVALRTAPLPYVPSGRFGQHMAVCTVHDPPSQAERDMALALTIPAATQQGLGDPAGRVVSSAPILAWLDPDDFPIHAASLCAYDVICILPGALVRLRETQMRAMGEWVRGGGCIAVVLDETPVKQTHVAFLNTLADTDAGSPWFTQAADGAVRRAKDVPAGQSGSAAGFGLENVFCTGAGRSIVIDGPPDMQSVRAGAWYNRKAFLWRVPAAMRKPVHESGAYRPPKDNQDELDAALAGIQRGDRFESVDAALSGILLTDVTTTVPGGILLLILTAFVISVGPLQYRVLKKFNLTRWTWVIFPLTAVLFTVLTILLANAWIGRNTRQRSLFVIDVGRRNEFVRCNRFDLFFSGRPMKTATEVQNAILSTATRQSFAYGVSRGVAYGAEQRGGATFAGSFPVHYKLEQEVAQWAPCIVRQLTFDPPGDLPAPPWDAIDEATPSNGNLARVPRSSSWSYAIARGSAWPQGQDAFSRHVLSLSASQPSGTHLLSLPLSPSGGPMDDLAVIDAADPTSKLLVMVKADARNTYIFRRQYHERNK